MPALRTRDAPSRSLEVTTDAPPPLPTLAIISPTPRAFTFPTTHNLTDSPYSSPSHSPFELSNIPITTTTTPPCTYRTLSPATTTASSPSPKERRPKKGDDDYIKRPENAFILFRRKCCEDRVDSGGAGGTTTTTTKKQRQADLSKMISQQWKGLSAEERQYWEQLAKEKKKEHEQMYPNYVYRPQRTKKGSAGGGGGGGKKQGRRESIDSDSSYMSFVLPMRQQHQHGRSSSAPTPSPYQSIQIPNVYLSAPSSPAPSLLPMISASRRNSDSLGFDFQSTYYDPAAVLQSPEYGGVGGLLNPNELLPPAQINSPPSSICSSPRSGPFTPFAAPSLEQAELDLSMHLFGNTNTSWWAPQDASSFTADDFDMNAIPPIELGLPKFHGVVDDYPGVYAFDFDGGNSGDGGGGGVVDGHGFGL
ncbi:uncharacterized protein BT62DRAFT_996930 [Guyanagaster necrorhizus]|uniref:HMG box domain-containing protein n=1 Tax=Guyanagaster necrorhizus TaxID=856835 RepID=A0A9P7VJK7_9AGAR|nr:uncharacterized protein BT62DRAFT_996930 [Guyanagaster necrorhizus MCA 3950]KAG7441812.1 hypothetical protein BT62DRAFT_996930 [Guyanagaster necrorhizus MCA 3950]